MQRRTMKLLITGCPRSGTTWMAVALRSTGINCGHEWAFLPGTKNRASRWGTGEWEAESSAHAPPHTPFPGAYVVHLVRHPLKVITSVAYHGGIIPGSRPSVGGQYIRNVLPALKKITDPVENAAVFWVKWNGMVVANERLRLEDATAGAVTRLARIVDPDASEATLPTPRNVTEGKLEQVTWDRVSHVPGLIELAEGYGYDVS